MFWYSMQKGNVPDQDLEIILILFYLNLDFSVI